MNHHKKSNQNVNLSCQICKINFNSPADHALHEFSKKHCDNLLKVSRNKATTSKPRASAKASDDPPPKVEQPPQPEPLCIQQDSFAKYGYYTPEEVYTVNTPSDLSRNCNVYQPEYVENQYQEQVPSVIGFQENSLTYYSLDDVPVQSNFSKKKKKVKNCQICNVTLMTVPEYDAHMKSPQHIWRLKSSGMGVSAHFVKASTDLHTTDKSNEQCMTSPEHPLPVVPESDSDSVPQTVSPSLFCDVCDLILNSLQQFNAHLNGKSHAENVQKMSGLKAIKNEVQNHPGSDQLYCYSCKISLNNIIQYNEHKNGKKHKIKCRQLMREGITIPPEERLPSWTMPKLLPHKPVVYPELYEKYVREKHEILEHSNTPLMNTDNISLDKEKFEVINASNQIPSNGNQNTDSIDQKSFLHKPFPVTSSTSSHIECLESRNLNNTVRESSEVLNKPLESVGGSEKVGDEIVSESKFIILNDDDFFKCNICDESLESHASLETHLNSETHFRKILDEKQKGTPASHLVDRIMADKSVIKLDQSGGCSCYFCDIVTRNLDEYKQHLNSTVHKHMQNDFIRKKISEVESIIPPNDKGVFMCYCCNEETKSLVEFCQHLQTATHLSRIAKRNLSKRKYGSAQGPKCKRRKKNHDGNQDASKTDVQAGHDSMETSGEAKISPPNNVIPNGAKDLNGGKPGRNRNFHRGFSGDYPGRPPPLMSLRHHPPWLRPFPGNPCLPPVANHRQIWPYFR